jgi:dTDP-glucose 4,6-dehydratase
MVTHVPDRKGHDRRYALDDSLLRGLGYAPRTGFGAGLAETLRWYRQNRTWWEPLKRPEAPARGDAAATASTTGHDGTGA